jgi:hypothetical protein
MGEKLDFFAIKKRINIIVKDMSYKSFINNSLASWKLLWRICRYWHLLDFLYNNRNREIWPYKVTHKWRKDNFRKVVGIKCCTPLMAQRCYRTTAPGLGYLEISVDCPSATFLADWHWGKNGQGADPPPPSSTRGKAGKSFERGNYPPPTHWDIRAIQPNHIKFRTWTALAPMWTPLINESAELTWRPSR